jgi:hypothetical protein
MSVENPAKESFKRADNEISKFSKPELSRIDIFFFIE